MAWAHLNRSLWQEPSPACGQKLVAALTLAAAASGAGAQNVIGAMNELAPFCLGHLCLGMSIEEARASLNHLELVDRLLPDQLCQEGQYRDVTAVANPRGQASVAAQFRRYAGAGGLEVQYRLWSISLSEASAAAGPSRQMSPADLDRLREGLTQRFALRPTSDRLQPAPRGQSLEGGIWLRALPQWQVGVTTQYNPRAGSSIILYALAEGDMAEWFQVQPGCGKASDNGASSMPSGRPPTATTPALPVVPGLPAAPPQTKPKPKRPNPVPPAGPSGLGT